MDFLRFLRFLRLFQINNTQGKIGEAKERKGERKSIYICYYSISLYIQIFWICHTSKVHPLVNEPYSPLVDVFYSKMIYYYNI